MASHGLMEALVYLGAAALIVPFAVRMGLGPVLGYLIAGCLIGPWALQLVTDPEAILEFAEIGVVLMLFMIGLELDPKRLWSLRRMVFGGGSLQMLVCGAGIALFCMALGLTWKVAALVGLTLSLSSTAIAVQAMKERNLTTTAVGRSSFAVLLFQDIAAIPLIAMIPLMASGGNTPTGVALLIAIAKIVAAIGIVVLLGRYITRPVLRFVAQAGLREIFSAVALLLVFGFGLLLEEAGLSMAMGAFLAGVLLASSEYRHALESDIEPFKGLLLGLFFIGVGMSIDFGTLIDTPVRVLTLTIGVILIYGDATRRELLESAGAHQATLFINAIDNVEDNLKITRMVQEHFPNLKQVVRARDMEHLIELRQSGIETVERETFESALKLGCAALEMLGLGHDEARRRADNFRTINAGMIEEIIHHPSADLLFRKDLYQRASALLEESLAEDRAHRLD